MRFWARFAVLLAALTVSLHYYCRVNECSVELQKACLYTSPAGINQLLLENNEFYRDQLHPVVVLVQDEYAKRVEPHILRLGSDLYRKIYVPVAGCARDKYSSVDLSGYSGWLLRQLARFRRRVVFYYNVTLRPSVQKMIHYCKLDEVCSRIHAKLGPFLEKLRFIWHYLGPLTERARSSVEQGYSELKSRYYHSSHWMGSGSFYEKTGSEEAVSRSDSETEVDSDEEDEAGDVETSTMTSTVIVTVTMDEQAVASPTDTDLEEVSELETLQDEFDAWSHLIDQKSSNIISMFNKDTEKASVAEIEKVEADIQRKTQQLSQLAQTYFQKLTKSIQDINCTAELDPSSGELIYFDRSGTTQLATYITRPLVRAIFKEAHTELEKMTQAIEQDLQQLTSRIEASVRDTREDILELYEEWGDVMITEWSKRLAYVDVVSAHFGADDAHSPQPEDLSAENWKRFLKLKKQVIRARDDLAAAPAELAAFKKFINKAQLVLETVTEESGEYLYILRARANLAFQERERQEREKSMAGLASELHSANETISEATPDHVEDPVHKPVQESLPVTEDQE
ncbi:hypothetical protein HG536_0D05760 [Torulaspora globosa]|uniref:Outer spore wall assembly protein SHE10 n=1 Tax=Torulaspora globosa TaxID=48254 RepID=A0A7G3ZHR9_9SACH|nr:uncharacterized protein HG536_0D05760 [Torulaspora globosa]QLL33055.1 hypothetical protein HG536_0D05760 [Torulaspora globosa]